MKRVAHGEPKISKGPFSSRTGLFFLEPILPFWIYIIQSESTGRYYCGQSGDPEQRLRQHNDPDYQLSKTTKRFAGPWKLIWTQECKDRSEATVLERGIKKRGISRYLGKGQSVESRLRRD